MFIAFCAFCDTLTLYSQVKSQWRKGERDTHKEDFRIVHVKRMQKLQRWGKAGRLFISTRMLLQAAFTPNVNPTKVDAAVRVNWGNQRSSKVIRVADDEVVLGHTFRL